MRFHTRAFTSLFLTIAFVGLSLSGVVLYVAPRCRVAEQIGWTVMGLEKEAWGSIHVNCSLFFVLAAVLHLALNWSIFWCYLKKMGLPSVKMKAELLAAVVLGGLVLAGSILGWPPFRSVVELHDQIKDSWGRPFHSPPAWPADDLSVQGIAEQSGLTVDQVVEALEEEGIVVAETEATVAEVAEANELTPDDIRGVMQRNFPGAAPGAGGGGESGRRGPGNGGGGGGGQGRGLGGGGGQGRGMGRGRDGP